MRAVLVDSGREALQLCRENTDDLGLAPRVQILPGSVDARTLTRVKERGPFHLVFADPPYAAQTPTGVLELVAGAALLFPCKAVKALDEFLLDYAHGGKDKPQP